MKKMTLKGVALKKLLVPKTLDIKHEVDQAVHIPYAYRFGKQYYGLTAVLRPHLVDDLSNSLLISFKVGLAFCSPSEPYGYKAAKGVREATKRLNEEGGHPIEMMIPLSKIMRGKLVRSLLEAIDNAVPPEAPVDKTLGVAGLIGFPERLLSYRHAHLKRD